VYRSRNIFTGFIIFGITFLVSCSNENQMITTPIATIDPSMVPMTKIEGPITQIPSVTPSPRPSDTAPSSLSPTNITITPTNTCFNELSFLEDITIPDGAQVTQGDFLDKRWKVENSGTCNWNNTYRIKLLDGIAMDATPEQALYPAKAGSTAVIRMIFTAPLEPGYYRSAWQAVSPAGDFFGDPIFIDIEVVPQL
jgi:hypothetical protein